MCLHNDSSVVQSVERRTVNPYVTGSSPVRGATFEKPAFKAGFLLFCVLVKLPGVGCTLPGLRGSRPASVAATKQLQDPPFPLMLKKIILMVRKMDSLFVYGTLRPGHVNAYILEDVGGEWLAGSVKGTFYERGWGAAADFPGIVLDEEGTSVEGFLFLSPHLDAHWPMLDEFEDGYDRVEVNVTTQGGKQIQAWIYQLQPRSE